MGKHILYELMKYLIGVVVVCALSIATDECCATIRPKPFWTSPTDVYVIDEEVVSEGSVRAFGKEYNFFDLPTSFCFINDATNASIYFFLDKGLNEIRLLHIIDEEVYRIDGFRGSGENAFSSPEAITVSPNLLGNVYFLFVLDTGNNRIRKLRGSVDYAYWPPTDYGHIYENEGDPNYGPLRMPHDIDYCEIGDDTDFSNDLLIVADTYNHRVLMLTAFGDVVWEIKGDEGGVSRRAFRFPYAATAIRADESGNAAHIYVVDRGNDRVVHYAQDDNFNVAWYGEYNMTPERGPGRTSKHHKGLSGLEDIEVDSKGRNSGVFVLDSRGGSIFQFDWGLNAILQEYGGLQFQGSPLHNLDIKNEEIGVLTPFTANSGAELYEFRASIAGLEVNPSVIEPPFEYAEIQVTITATSYLDLWIEDDVGGFVCTVEDDRVVEPSVHYEVWDGMVDDYNYATAGMYKIKVRIRDAIWQEEISESEIDVEIIESPYRTVLVTQTELSSPDWSPDGQSIVYSGNRDIKILDLETESVSVLTGDHDGITQSHPAWSPDGSKIAWTCRLGYSQYHNYIMDADGMNKIVISDTSGAPALIVEEMPQWSPSGEYLSFADRKNELDNRLMAYELDGSLMPTAGSTPVDIGGGGFTSLIRDYTWASGMNSQIAVVGVQGVFRNIEDTWQFIEVIENPPDMPLHSIDWSPDDQQFILSTYREMEQYSRTYVVSSDGGHLAPGGAGGEIDSIPSVSSGISWSPCGTKYVLPVRGIDGVSLVGYDIDRSADKAHPVAIVNYPISQDTFGSMVPVIGTVDDNYSIKKAPPKLLSELDGYSLNWGVADDPAEWRSEGVTLYSGCADPTSYDCPIESDTLAVWNTAAVKSGKYTIRLIVTDGDDTYSIRRTVIVEH